MTPLLVKKLDILPPSAADLSSIFDKEGVPFHTIACVNWDKYPYKPNVQFRIAHNGTNLFLHYRVDEQDIKAVCGVDNGQVWKDSCAEFFVSFNDDFYYNIECNCIAKILIATGKGRGNRTPAPAAVINHIDRWSSLGNLPLENKSGKWELSLIIPASVFHLNTINTFDGIRCKGNFYKCGDDLKVPHFLSWNPINTENPDFHRPEFFGELLFDK